jgi:hypothetical protein
VSGRIRPWFRSANPRRVWRGFARFVVRFVARLVGTTNPSDDDDVREHCLESCQTRISTTTTLPLASASRMVGNHNSHSHSSPPKSGTSRRRLAYAAEGARTRSDVCGTQACRSSETRKNPLREISRTRRFTEILRSGQKARAYSRHATRGRVVSRGRDARP